MICTAQEQTKYIADSTTDEEVRAERPLTRNKTDQWITKEAGIQTGIRKIPTDESEAGIKKLYDKADFFGELTVALSVFT